MEVPQVRVVLVRKAVTQSVNWVRFLKKLVRHDVITVSPVYD